MSRDVLRFRHDPLRRELLHVYAEVDSLYSSAFCEVSTECCRFLVTGREPLPTAIEVAEVELALRHRGGLPRQRTLPAADGPCPLLADSGQCAVYEARPFGCRTFYCHRASLFPPKRESVLRLSRELERISERYAPRAPKARPLSRVLAALPRVRY